MNHVALHPDKTKFMLITIRQKRQNIVSYLHPLTVLGITIEEVLKHRVLRVVIDNNLSWTPHVNSPCKKKKPTKVYQLFKIKHFANFHARKISFGTHIQCLIDYGSTLWDSASKNSLKPLHSLYKRSLKLILKQSSLEQDDINLLNIRSLHAKLKYNKGICKQKIMSGNALPPVTRLFPMNSSREQTKINIPRPRIDLFKTSLTFSGASLWKSSHYQ